MNSQEIQKKQGENYPESIIDTIETAIFIIDVDQAGEVRYNRINRTYMKITGLRQAEIAGKTPTELSPGFIDPEMVKTLKTNCKSCIESRQMLRYEEVIPLKGKKIYWLTTLSPLMGGNKQVSQIIGTATDITALKLQENELQEYKKNLEKIITERTLAIENKNKKLQEEIAEKGALEEEFRATNDQLLAEIQKNEKHRQVLEEQHQQFITIFNNYPEVIYVVDPETYEVLFVNEHFARMLGSDPVGKKCYEEFQGLTSPCSFCTNNILKKNKGKPYTWEFHNEKINNIFLITDQLIKWPGNRKVRFEVATNITEKRRKAEKLQREIEQRLAVEEELRASNEKLYEEINQRLKTEIDLKKEIEERWLVEEQLRQSNANLIEEIQKREKAEAALLVEACKLARHVKEINALHETERIINNPGLSTEMVMNGIISQVLSCLQYPDSACCSIIMDNKSFRSPNFIDTPIKISHEIESNGTIKGTLQAGYRVAPISQGREIFSEEERTLIGTIASKIGKYYENLQKDTEIRQKTIALESTISPFAITSLEGRFIYVNQAFISTWGYNNKSELIGKTPMEIIKNPEEARRIFTVLREKGSYCGELATNKKNNALFYVKITANTFFGHNRKPIGHMASFTDITKEKLARERIEKLNNLWHDVLGVVELHEKFSLVTQAIVDMFDVDFARIWIIAEGDLCNRNCIHSEVSEGPLACKIRDKCLHLASSSGRYKHLNGKFHRRIPFGSYKIGRIAAGKENKYITNNVAGDPQVLDPEWAIEHGIQSFAGYRISTGTGETKGVLALFKNQKITPEEDILLETISNNLSQVIIAYETEKALKESTSRFRRIAGNARDMIYRMSLPEGIYEYVSPASQEIWGFTPDEIMQKPLLIRESIHPDFINYFNEEWQKLLKGDMPETYEYKIIDKNGHEKWLNQRNTLICDDNNTPIAIEGIVTDISKRKKLEIELQNENESRAAIEEELRATNEELTEMIVRSAKIQEALEKSEKKFHTLYDHAPDMYISVSPKDGRVLECNESLLFKTGYSRNEVVGRKIFDLYHESCLPLVHENFREFVINGRIIHKELVIKKKDGKTIDVNLNINVIRDKNGKILYSVSSWRDITEWKKLQNEIISEKLFNEHIINSLPGIYYMFDSQGRFINWNGNFSKVTGYSNEELANKTHVDFFTGEDKHLIEERIKKVFETGYSNAEANLTTKTGQSIPYYFTGIKTEINQNYYMIGTGTDMSEMANARNALIESENRYYLALEAADEGIWDWYPGNPVVYYSDRWKAQVGYLPDELENTFDTWEALLHPDDYDRMHLEVASYLENPEGRFIAEFRMRHKNGTYRWIRNTAASYKDINGNVVRLIGAHTDITEEKLANEQLRENKQFIESILDISPDLIYIYDLQDYVNIYSNDGLSKILGYSKEKIREMGNTVIKQLMHPDDFENYLSNTFPLYFTLKDKEVIEHENRMKHKNGKWHWLRSKELIFKRDQTGKAIQILGIIEDVTEQKAHKQILQQTLHNLEESNKELEQFAYIASHDLQEPLRMVSSFLQLLVKRYAGKLDETALEYIDFAVDGANRMKLLIKDLLQFSRVGTRGKDFVRTNLNQEVNNVLKTLEMQITNANASIKVHPLPELYSDNTQIMQLFQNLISNALKFRGHNKPEIEIKARKKKDYYEFSVTDNGIGLDEQYAERIFIIFQRLHTKEEFEGTGIGLAVCKKIVERHGGKIWVKSTPGKGSTFYFTLPLQHQQ